MYKKNVYNNKEEVHYAGSLSFYVPPSLVTHQSIAYGFLSISLSQLSNSNF